MARLDSREYAERQQYCGMISRYAKRGSSLLKYLFSSSAIITLGICSATAFEIPSNTTVVIDSNNSPWTVPVDDLNVNGTLEIGGVGSPGSVSVLSPNSATRIGTELGSVGNIEITEPGSNLATQAFQMGTVSGAIGYLTVTNGGLIRSENASLALAQGSAALVMVDGPGSIFTVNGLDLWIGTRGQAQMNLSNGGVAETLNAAVVLGVNSSGYGNGNITGAGSRLTSKTALIVGEAGRGILTVEDHAIVQTGTYVRVGNSVGSEGFISVKGSGSQLRYAGSLGVGVSGIGTLQVDSGGAVVGGGNGINIGFRAGSVGDILVTGQGSMLNNGSGANSTINVGVSGVGGLNVVDGAEVHTNDLILGLEATGEGKVEISDAGTTFRNSGSTTIGESGTGTLTLIEGGLLDSPDGVTIAKNAGSTGDLIIGSQSNATPAAPGFLDTSSISFGDGVGRVILNHTAQESEGFTLPEITSGPGALEAWSGVTYLSGSNGYSGPTTIFGGTLKASGADVFSQDSIHDIHSDGTLDLNGFDQQISTISNAGLIAFGDLVDTSLTASSYTGTGGRIQMNAVLASDNSPSNRLIIDGGAATGSTSLFVNNIGGLGDVTTGNGIPLVDAINGGVTNPGAFQLGTRVAAGPYEYRLYRGSKDASDSDNWYLRNELTPIPPDPPTPPGPPTPPNPPAPPLPPVPAEFIPEYRREVSLYAAVQPMAAIYGRHLIDTLHERMGELEQLRGRDDLSNGNRIGKNGWGRLIGHWGQRDGDKHGIYGSGSGPEFDYSFGALQAGLDLYGSEYQNGGRDYAGLYFAFGRGDMDVSHNLLTRTIDGGKNDFTASTLGGYYTYFGSNDWYIDTVVQATRYSMTTQWRSGLSEEFPEQDISGTGWAASIEAGYPFKFDSGWQLEPQAQLMWQGINFRDFNDGAADVRFRDLNSVAGRVGTRVARTWFVEETGTANPGRQATVWGQVDAWHEFDGDTAVELSSARGFVPFSADLDESWVRVGIGGSLQVTSNATIFGNVNYDVAFDGNSYGIDGKVGLRMDF